MHVLFNNLFYVAYISMIVLYGSLSPSQLTAAAKKSFHVFYLLILVVVSVDMARFLLGFNDQILRYFLLYAQVICIFIILYQLRKVPLSRISACSYLFTLVALTIYSFYSVVQFYF